MKPPRCRTSTLPVIIAMAGHEPPCHRDHEHAGHRDSEQDRSELRRVSHNTAPEERIAMIVNSRMRPYMSARRPIRFMENSVQRPPLRKMYLS